MSHNIQKKIAVVNDFSGFGRCSTTVSLPIISAMRIQCCAVLTSILSNHTAYENYFFDDYTRNMREYIENWKKLGLSFEGIATGFLGSKEQIEIVIEFIKYFKGEGTVVLVDPVMGDNGKKYATYTEKMCREMKKLVKYADILTPNITEACMLTDTDFKIDGFKTEDIRNIAANLSTMGPRKVVITGINQGSFVANYVYDRDDTKGFIKTKKIGEERSGTGDVFSSIIIGDAVNNVELLTSVKKASRFIKKCIKKSIEMDIPKEDGVCFEEYLRLLAK